MSHNPVSRDPSKKLLFEADATRKECCSLGKASGIKAILEVKDVNPYQ